MTIITFNAGLLRLSLLGYKVFEPTSYLNERLAALPAVLIDSNADIIALQEVYFKDHQDYLKRMLRPYYPNHFVYNNRTYFNLHNNGLMIFSKIPILTSNFTLFSKSPFDEKVLFGRGILAATILIDKLGKVTLFNIHTTVGGAFNHPESNKTNKLRAAQILQAIRLSQESLDSIPMLLGDFNAGPEVSEINYRKLLENDFVDVFEYCRRTSKQKNVLQVTWHPENPLNKNGLFANSPPQRIDHVFVPSKFIKLFNNIDAQIIFNEPLVNIQHQQKLTLSDHYGLKVKFS